jgi:hypothetical protein
MTALAPKLKIAEFNEMALGQLEGANENDGEGRNRGWTFVRDDSRGLCSLCSWRYGYYAFGPYRHDAAQRFYQCEHFNCASGCCPIGSSMYPGGYCGWHVVGWRSW